jgi:hypothetical protein
MILIAMAAAVSELLMLSGAWPTGDWKARRL